MGKVTRKRYSADFKAKVALEAIKGDLTLEELASKHGIHQTMIATWKRQAIERMGGQVRGGFVRQRGEDGAIACQDRPIGGGT